MRTFPMFNIVIAILHAMNTLVPQIEHSVRNVMKGFYKEDTKTQ